jgi:dihydroorotase
MQSITTPMLFDAHVHFRQDSMLRRVVPYTSRCCRLATVMPNTDPPITNPTQLSAYRHEVVSASKSPYFLPIFAAYLTETTTVEDVQKMAEAGISGYKIYPKNKGKHGTTGSGYGLTEEVLLDPPKALKDAIDEIKKRDLIVHVHAEWPDTYFLDAEEKFLDSAFMHSLAHDQHRLIVEHISSAAGLSWVRYARKRYDAPVGGSITLHHLEMTTDDVLGRNHNFCRPPAKEPSDLKALREAVLYPHRNEHCFFMGSDSAPHPLYKKHTAEACAGCFTAPALAERLVMFFEQNLKDFPGRDLTGLQLFTDFTYRNSCEFYRLVMPISPSITLRKEEWLQDRSSSPYPWRGSEKVTWKLETPAWMTS